MRSSLLRLNAVALVFVGVTLQMRFASASDVLSPYSATNWLAYILGTGQRFMSFDREFVRQTPEVIIFRDGRILWRVGSGEEWSQPEWRTGKISEEGLRTFLAAVKTTNAIREHTEITKNYIFNTRDERIQTVGVSLAGANRIFRPYTHDSTDIILDPPGPNLNEASIRAVQDLAKLIYNLRDAAVPSGGKQYDPNDILVSFENWGLSTGSSNVPLWPLDGDPLPAHSIIRRYHGQKAVALLSVIRNKGNAFTDGKNWARVFWRPAMDPPYVEQDYEREHFTAKKWELARSGAVRLDKKGQDGMLYRFHMVKDLLRNYLRPGKTAVEVFELLGKSDTDYSLVELHGLGIERPAKTTRAIEFNLSWPGYEPASNVFLMHFFDGKDRLILAKTMVH